MIGDRILAQPSLIFVLVFNEQVSQLPRDETELGFTKVQRIAMSLTHSIRMTAINSIADAHCLQDYRPFERITSEWKKQLHQLSQAIALQYWVHSGVAHQLTDIRRK